MLSLTNAIKYRLYDAKKNKIFCIGRNKTGTTSIGEFFKKNGYFVGNQRKAEKLFPFYLAGNFTPIIEYCKSAQVFQDCPFSYPNTYKYLDEAFPNSIFILTMRDSADQWFGSVINSRIKKFKVLPTKEDLQNSTYAYPGYLWDTHHFLYNTSNDDLFNEDVLKKHYSNYNNEVIAYFQGRKNFIIINISQHEDYIRLCNFLNIKNNSNDAFPWKNKT